MVESRSTRVLSKMRKNKIKELTSSGRSQIHLRKQMTQMRMILTQPLKRTLGKILLMQMTRLTSHQIMPLKILKIWYMIYIFFPFNLLLFLFLIVKFVLVAAALICKSLWIALFYVRNRIAYITNAVILLCSSSCLGCSFVDLMFVSGFQHLTYCSKIYCGTCHSDVGNSMS